MHHGRCCPAKPAIHGEETGPQSSGASSSHEGSEVPEADVLERLTVVQLRDILRHFGLPVGGIKVDLIQRLTSRNIIPDEGAPTEKQFKFMRDLEKQLGERIPASALISRKDASAWINKMIKKRDEKKKRDGTNK